MKRFEMIEYLIDELNEFIGKLETSRELEPIIVKKEAHIILDMIEGFDMSPPPRMRYIDQENGNTLCSEVCELDDE